MVGDVGTGKTMMSRHLLDRLREDGTYETALIILTHADFSSLWLLKKIAALLGVEEVGEEKARVVSQICERLMQIYGEGRKALIIIDEANLLRNREVLEDLRGLLNVEVADARLISFLLTGLPEMEKNLLGDAALKQRVALRCEVQPMSPETVKGYIKHRLKVAGRSEDLFTESALDAIALFSGGSPRLVNAICDNALLEGFLAERPLIDQTLVQEVAQSLGLEEAKAGA
jgi:type II secretory pathway predicted ATPase ExeA